MDQTLEKGRCKAPHGRACGMDFALALEDSYCYALRGLDRKQGSHAALDQAQAGYDAHGVSFDQLHLGRQSCQKQSQLEAASRFARRITFTQTAKQAIVGQHVVCSALLSGPLSD